MKQIKGKWPYLFTILIKIFYNYNSNPFTIHDKTCLPVSHRRCCHSSQVSHCRACWRVVTVFLQTIQRGRTMVVNCLHIESCNLIYHFFWLGFQKNKAVYTVVPSVESWCFYKRNSSTFEVLNTTFNISLLFQLTIQINCMHLYIVVLLIYFKTITTPLK